MCNWVFCELGEGVTRLRGVGAPKIKARAMKIVATRLSLHSNNASHSFAKLSVVVLQRKLRFSNRVDVGVHNDDAENGILVISSVQLVSRATEVLPVYKYLLASLRVFVSGVVPADHFLCAWRGQLQTGEIAIQER